MHIVFATTSCSKSMYQSIFEMRNKKILDPAQKFFEQLISGVAQVGESVSVSAISIRPVSASTCKKKWFSKSEEIVERVKYVYPFFVNGKMLRFLTTYISTFFSTLRELNKHKGEDRVLICDPLQPHCSAPARLAAKIAGVKTIAVVTDLPRYATSMKTGTKLTIKRRLQNLYEGWSEKETRKYDGYIFLTEAMNDEINKKNAPVLIVEGSIDANIVISFNGEKKEKRTVVYAGGVYEKYGVKKLVESFLLADLPDVELHIYGEGAYVEELMEVSEKNANIVYKGCVLNTELPLIESQATLLVNPRSTDEDYTKFSFPSKTLEYLSSGTPVLSTRLLGIPSEYDDYLYWFNDESVEGMSETLVKILGKSEEELVSFGIRAKDFVFSSKSNVVQGKRIVNFVDSIIKGEMF